MSRLLIIPQAWASSAETLPEAWLLAHGPGLCRVWGCAPTVLNVVAEACGVSAKLLATRMELEQRALSYAWDGSRRDYRSLGQFTYRQTLRNAGVTAEDFAVLTDCERWKLYYLCGCDKTDAGPRDDGWFGPDRQLYGCAARFAFVYRGRAVPSAVLAATGPLPDALSSVGESELYRPGVAVTRDGVTITPANQASADCLRYTSSMEAQRSLADMGRRWWPEDYEREEHTMAEKVAVVDKGHGGGDPGAVGKFKEADLNEAVGEALAAMLKADGWGVFTVPRDLGPSARGSWSADHRPLVSISIHHNAGGNGSGVEAYYNGEKAPNGKKLALAVTSAMMKRLGLPAHGQAARGVWINPHTGKASTLGFLSGGGNWSKAEYACLVECGFVDSAADAKVLGLPDYATRAATAIRDGIYEAIGQQEPADPPAPEPTSWEAELAGAVERAKAIGVSDGTRLGDNVTRGELLVMLDRAGMLG